jgi:hypothetical protein
VWHNSFPQHGYDISLNFPADIPMFSEKPFVIKGLPPPPQFWWHIAGLGSEASLRPLFLSVVLPSGSGGFFAFAKIFHARDASCRMARK